MKLYPQISVGIPHRFGVEGTEGVLDRCISSLMGFDELIVLGDWGLGIPQAFNRLLEMMTGDYLILVANDCWLKEGTLRDLPDDGGVSVPFVNGKAAWNPVYCFPRWILNFVGGFDEQFSPCYYEDDDYIMRLHCNDVPIIVKPEVEFTHPRPGLTIETVYGDPTVKNEALEISHQKFVAKWGREPMQPVFVR